MKVVVTPEAADDAKKAAVWYRRHDPRTVAGFRRRFNELVRLLADFPELGTLISGTPYRRVSLDRYPYSLICYPTGTSLLIVAVLHDRQSIERWLEDT